jgi:two-component system alkaline phosphatase synthesis response regulator PhoP
MTNKSVVICDDDQILVTIVKAVLAKKDFRVYTADNGNAALKMIRSVKPQLVFLDLDMPEKNGFEVLQELQGDEAGKAYKIVISGHEDKASQEKAASLGANAVWVKPFNASKLMAEVDSLIKQGKI